MGSVRRLPGRKRKPARSSDGYEKHFELKVQGLERLLGPMHDLVGHAIVPFQVGGAVDMYYFPHAIDGTAFATMELIEPDGSGPKPSRIGTYEFVAFTRHRIPDGGRQDAFNAIERRVCSIFTAMGHYAYQAVLNPLDTCEAPAGKGKPNRCLVLDEYTRPGVEFRIGSKKHGLLLCIEIFRQEMQYALEHGSGALLERLKAGGHYPYSDLDREPVV